MLYYTSRWSDKLRTFGYSEMLKDLNLCTRHNGPPKSSLSLGVDAEPILSSRAFLQIWGLFNLQNCAREGNR